MDYSRRFKRGALLVTVLALVPFLASAQTFTNPITYTNIPDLLRALVLWILGLIAFVAVLSLVWGGTMYIISFGDDAGLKRAKGIVMWSIVGLAVALLAFFIVEAVGRILGVA